MVGKFLEYTEIRTKITSLFAFLMTIAYIFFLGEQVNWYLTLIFFTSMFIFDLATTSINNFIDTRTNHMSLPFKRSTALAIIFILIGMSTVLGLYLAYLTDIVVLLIGALCFICGVLYTFGPVPISRQPLGEILSGIFYGLFIPFLILYINLPEGSLLRLKLNIETISLDIQVLPVVSLLMLSIIPMGATANIMLANNICDLKKDVETGRFTLPYYLKKRALTLFAGIYYAIYIDLMVMVLFKLLSPLCLLSLLTIIPVQKNIKVFQQLQDKAVTFVNSIKNYIIIMGTLTLIIFVSAIM